MSHLKLGKQSYQIPEGESFIGSDPSCAIRLEGSGIAARHAVIQGLAGGQAAVRAVEGGHEVKVNGVALGAQPNPLLHGDKLEIGDLELIFVDESRGGSTQYVSALDPGVAAQSKKAGAGKPTAATGGRLVSLTDGREYAVGGSSLTIGREASNDIVVTHKNVSRKHAEIAPTPEGYILIDSSTNGTYVNGDRISGQHLLARADVIRVGNDEFRFYADAPPVPEENAPESKAQTPPPAPAGEDPQRPQPGATAADPETTASAPAPPSPSPGEYGAPPPGAEHRLGNTMHGIPSGELAELRRQQRETVSPRTGEDLAAGAGEPAPKRSTKAGGPLATLSVRSGSRQGERIPISVPVANIGRAEYNDVMLPDDSVSTIHAKLQRREGIWMLVDLDSTNGTFVDGERVSGEAALAPGAVVRFGEVKTFFEPQDESAEAEQGSSTKVISAMKMPPPGQEPPAGSQGERKAPETDNEKRGFWPFK